MANQVLNFPLEVYRMYLEINFEKVFISYTITQNLLRSFRFLQILKPSKIEFADSGTYESCKIFNKEPCNCVIKNSSSPLETHWDGKPRYVDVAFKLPVSSFMELILNRGRLYCWKWAIRVTTEQFFLDMAKTNPELNYDAFTYPVKTPYLTPETTKAAVFRWLKTYCPNLNKKFDVVPKDRSCIS